MRCLVTGGTGFVGSHLVEALLARGHEVRCLVRDPGRPRWLAGLPVQLVAGDVVHPASLPAAIAGVEAIYHVAGLVRTLDRRRYDLVNHQGVVNLLEACSRVGQQFERILLLSSQAAAGPSPDGAPLDETAPCRPVSPYGWSKLRGEQAALAWPGLPVTVVRPPTVYGPRDADGLLIFQMVARGLALRTGPDQLVSLVEVNDLVHGIIRAAESPRAVGSVYFVANDHPVRLSELLACAGRALGQKVRTVPVPRRAVWLAALGSELAARVRGQPTVFDRHKAAELAQPYWVCDARRAREELGFQQRVSLEAGFFGVAKWYRQQGWL